MAAPRVTDEIAHGRMRAAGLTPLTPYPGRTVKPWPARCNTCDASVAPSLNSASKGHGCRACGHRRAGRQLALSADEAVRRMRAAGWDPMAPYPGSERPWKCQCRRCGAVQAQRLHGAQHSKGRGCRSCSLRMGARRRHGTANRWRTGCRCDSCRDAHNRNLRRYRRRHAAQTLPPSTRRSILAAIRAGTPLVVAAAQAGTTQQRIWALARAVSQFGAHLDAALMWARDPAVPHGTPSGYRHHRCRCPECRAAHH